MMKTVINCISRFLNDKRRRFLWWRQRHCLTRHDFGAGFGNLKYWFPIVWKDRWWDHSFLYSILRHKLAQMEKGFRHHAISLNAEKDAENIKKCKLLLDRLIKDDYIDYMRGDNIRKSFEEEERMIKQDLDLLFKTMRTQIRTWWD